MKNIGEIIKEYRTKKGITQEELGNKLFVTKQTISKWECGKTDPDIEMLRRIAVFLDIPSDEIIGAGYVDPRASSVDYQNKKENKELKKPQIENLWFFQ
ncbi:MAG: helix-turn-helix transcriptional regulator, partial [Ruminococcaceae bacterium]|nr:helix-turn-helix transcriptional regulator [Oscillospiraceae bacterium]